MNLNQANIIGRVGNDPEVKALPSGGMVATFSVATTRKWVQAGEKKEQTEWHNIVFFGDNLIEKVISPYVVRGSEVYIGGRLQTRQWEKDGVKHYRTEIVGEHIQLGAKPSGDSATRPARTPKSKEEQDKMSADDQYDALGGGEDEPFNASTTVQKKVAGAKGRTTKTTDGEDIDPNDIPF